MVVDVVVVFAFELIIGEIDVDVTKQKKRKSLKRSFRTLHDIICWEYCALFLGCWIDLTWMLLSLFMSDSLKMTQINFVSRNQLHSTANSYKHLNFGLSWPG